MFYQRHMSILWANGCVSWLIIFIQININELKLIDIKIPLLYLLLLCNRHAHANW